jgi:hypothetical protein
MIKKLKPDNRGKYINNNLIVFLKIKGIIDDLSLLYVYETNGQSELMNQIRVIIV